MAEADAYTGIEVGSDDTINDANWSDPSASLFFCHPCQDDDPTVPARFTCGSCSEFYCDGCSSDHRSFKATKEHNLVNLQNKIKCEPCSNKGVTPELSSYYCVDCEEGQCEGCAKKHKKMKSTRDHVLLKSGETQPEARPDQTVHIDQTRGNSIEAAKADEVTTEGSEDVENDTDLPETNASLYFCHTCDKDDRHVPATFTCVICAEFYCNACTYDHETFTATKSHGLVNLQTKLRCVPCSNKGVTPETSSQYCVKCDEGQCEGCSKKHNKMKSTCDHVVIHSGVTLGTTRDKEADQEKSVEQTRGDKIDIAKADKVTTEGSGDVKNDTDMPETNAVMFLCHTCDEHDRHVPATFTCVTCAEFYCDACTYDHETFTATKSHGLVNLQTKLSCVPCSNKGVTPEISSQYCVECDEGQCEGCSKKHKKMKSTRDHVVIHSGGTLETTRDAMPGQENRVEQTRGDTNDNAKADEVTTEGCGDVKNNTDLPEPNANMFLCHPCDEDGPLVPATFTCVTCAEFYCDACTEDHKTFTATKSHGLVNLQTKLSCVPCSNKGVTPGASSQYCVECDEGQCEGCSKKHNKMKSTRDHVVIQSGKLETTYDKKSDQVTNVEQTREQKDNNTRPGKPYVSSKTLDNIVIRWNPPEELLEENSYQLRYRENNANGKWRFAPEAFTETTGTLHNLQSGTEFVFQVRMVDNENEGPYSELSDPVETIVSAAKHKLEFMYDVKGPKDGMKLKRLPLQENEKARNECAKTRKLFIGKDERITTKEMTILLVGATGTGKSTLVDGMMNYILGVKWEDDYRLVVVDLEEDEQKQEKDQAESQTEWITCYEISPLKGGRLDYKLTIIDTPGFGDTRGIDRDKGIVKQLHQLFKRSDDAGVPSINAVCFIVKAPDARLTATQKYIFSSILSIFGKDIEDNILTLITFADGKEPPVLSALKAAEMPHEEYFLFNNSGLHANNSGSAKSEFASMFWNMGCASFDRFFGRLAQMKPKSLSQTQNVLQQRETIENKVEALTPLLNTGLIKIGDIRREMKVLVQNKAMIQDNKDFTYTVEETRMEQVSTPTGVHTTTCLTCNFTCHKHCVYADNTEKKSCCAMDINGYCDVCPRKCVWHEHKNVPYIFEYHKVEVTKTYDEKLKLYNIANNDKDAAEKIVKNMHAEICDIEQKLAVLMEELNECHNKLRQIALRPDPLSVVDHIDILIESEKQEKRPDYLFRIASLQKCKETAEYKERVIALQDVFAETKHEVKTEVQIENTEQSRQKSKEWLAGIFQIPPTVKNIIEDFTDWRHGKKKKKKKIKKDVSCNMEHACDL